MKYTLVTEAEAESVVRCITSESGLDADEWAAQIVQRLTPVIISSKGSYLTMGPYWWPVKRIMVNHGANLTDPTDEQINEVTLGREYLDVAAAVITHYREGKTADENAGIFEVKDDAGNVVRYQVTDPEMVNNQ